MLSKRDIILISVAVLIVIAIIVLIIMVPRIDSFSSPKEKFDTWKSRISELKMVPITYLSYFAEEDVKSIKYESQPGKIFISIASYRDDQCPDTVKNLIENSDSPHNLHFYICQQNDLIDRDCIPTDLKGAKVNIEKLYYTKARGPVWARYRIQQKWSGEEYFLQIDSHTRMIKGWDTILKNQLNELPPKTILSQYPNEYKNVQRKDRGDPEKEDWKFEKLRGGLYVHKFGPEGFVRFTSDYTDPQRLPLRSIGWAAGFSFSKSDFIQDVPIDPYLYVFFGEQLDIAARAYTHGYNLYSPSVNVAFHIYDRSHRKTFWELTHQKPLETLSRFRLYVKLGMLKPTDIPKEYRAILNDLDKYSIGKVRSLEEYEKEAKINMKEEIRTL